MRFRGLDLNLLSAFSILMQERSVSRAARRLHLSQPAVSAALSRLRAYFGDELLVLEGKRMFPTPLAETLAPRIEEALRSIGTILDSADRFDPATSARTFRIVASDYVVMVLIRALIRVLETAAPDIRVVVELPGERASARLDEGAIDLIVTPEEFAAPNHPVEQLLSEAHVLVGWVGNPAMKTAPDTAAVLQTEHVGVLLGADTPAAFVDRQMRYLGLTRRVVVTVPDFAAVPWMVIGTARVGIMHERLARMMATHLPLAIHPLPFDFPPMREVLQHHRARGNDPGLSWLREQLHAVAAG